MTTFSFVPLARLRPLFDLSREDGISGNPPKRSPHRITLLGRNELSPSEALALVGSIKAKALEPIYPDSTETIRDDRDKG